MLTDDNNGEDILGYYSLALTLVSLDELPVTISKQYQGVIQAALLGRLAVNKTAQGRGLGGFLLIDAILKAYQASLILPTPMLIVDAKNQDAKTFYQYYGFKSLPENELKLMLTMKSAKALLLQAELIDG